MIIAILMLFGCAFETDSVSSECTAVVLSPTTGWTRDSCTGDDFCLNPEGSETGTCTSAFGRRYDISVIGARISSPYNPYGDCWDTDCEAPDAFVSIEVDGSEIGRTTSHLNFRNPFYNPPFKFSTTLMENSQIVMHVWDEDDTTDEYAGGCSKIVTGELIRNRALICETSDEVLIFSAISQ